MEQEAFTLRSGAKLHLNSGPWELVEKLFIAIKGATHGKKDDPDAGSLIVASEQCLAAVQALYPWATYDGVKIFQDLFNDKKVGPKIRFDSMEIKEKLIEFHMRPFFLQTFSESTVPTKALLSENQRSL